MRARSPIDQKISMADTSVIDLDTGVAVEKRGRGHPRGSKNKLKGASMGVSSSSAPVKRRPDCPLGSKNKPNPSTFIANKPLDAIVACHNTPPTSGNTFSFFAFTGAQCREQQRVPLKFTEFMDGQELREAIL
jgi:hypothetical protein